MAVLCEVWNRLGDLLNRLRELELLCHVTYRPKILWNYLGITLPMVAAGNRQAFTIVLRQLRGGLGHQGPDAPFYHVPLHFSCLTLELPSRDIVVRRWKVIREASTRLGEGLAHQVPLALRASTFATQAVFHQFQPLTCLLFLLLFFLHGMLAWCHLIGSSFSFSC